MIEKEANSERGKALSAVRALKTLHESEGWRILSEFMTHQVKARTDHVMLQPRGDTKSEWDNEFKKGEVSAFRLILEFPFQELETNEAVAEVFVNDDSSDDSSSDR